MKTRRKYSKLLSGMVSLVVLFGMFFCWSNISWAATTNSSVTINAGTLHFATDVPPDANFTAIDLETLNGLEMDFFTHLANFSVIDARGSGEGWTVQVSATELKNTGNKIGIFSLKQPTQMVQAYSGTTNTIPAIKSLTNGWVAIDGGTQNIITATANNGLGKWTIDWGATNNNALKLSIDPGTAKAGLYTSTITWGLIAPVVF